MQRPIRDLMLMRRLDIRVTFTELQNLPADTVDVWDAFARGEARAQRELAAAAAKKH